MAVEVDITYIVITVVVLETDVTYINTMGERVAERIIAIVLPILVNTFAPMLVGIYTIAVDVRHKIK